MKYIIQLLHFIKTRGVSDQNREDNELTSLLNFICFVSFAGTFTVFILMFLTIQDYVYMSVSLLAMVIFMILIVLHHFHLVQEAKLYFSLIIPLWYVTGMILVGGQFSQSISAGSIIAITYLMQNDHPRRRNFLIAYNIVIFILPSLYISFYPPLYGVREYPLDDILVFLISLGWISIIFSIYKVKNEEYIKSLKNKNKELEQKTKELERFTYIASHDLKSPLRNIISFLSLAKGRIKKGNYENIDEYLGYAETGAYQMKELVEGVLEVSKIDHKNVSKKTLVDLNDALAKAMVNIQQEIEEKGALVTSDSLPTFFCHEADFLIVFQNLLQNGLKYNDSPKPTIIISVESNSGIQTIHFTDNGIGIPSEYHDQIFEFFKRLHTSQQYPGTGLGLGLVKKIVEKYGATVSVVSEPGSGSRFSVSLPMEMEPKFSEHPQSLEFSN